MSSDEDVKVPYEGADADQLTSLTLAPEYGYVVIVAALFFFLNFAQTVRIGQLRARYKIEYPQMSAPEFPDFECAQRVHHNTHEQLPFALVNMAFAGVRHPVFAAAFGGVFFLARVAYSIGYWTGKPKLRLPGSLIGTFFGMLPLVGFAISSGAGMIGWW